MKHLRKHSIFFCLLVCVWESKHSYVTMCGRVPLCADCISLRDRLRCVKAEDECRFNHSVSFGTQSFSLLTSIWMKREEEQKRKKTSGREVEGQRWMQPASHCNKYLQRRDSLTAFPFLFFFPSDLLQVIRDKVRQFIIGFLLLCRGVSLICWSYQWQSLGSAKSICIYIRKLCWSPVCADMVDQNDN